MSPTTDAGPSPVEMVSAALGSCIAITVRMVAERKGWPLEGMDVNVEQSQVPVAQITNHLACGISNDIFRKK